MITGSFNVSRADKIHSALETYCDAWNAYDREDDIGVSVESFNALRDSHLELETLIGGIIVRPVRHGRYRRVIGAKFYNGLILHRA